VKLAVPFPAGSQTDLVARLVAQNLSTTLGATFVVENKPGASGTIAAAYVAKAPADGYTLLMTSAAIQAMNFSLLKQPPYAPEDFAPIGRVASTGMALMVRSDSPIKTVDDLVAAAKKDPGKLTAGYGSPGAQIALAVMKHDAKIDVLDVPYKGIPAAVTDMIGGQVDFTFVDFGNAISQAKGGKARALGVTPKDGSRLRNDVPPLATPFPTYSISSWYGVMAPAGTPAPVLQKLDEALQKAMKDPEIASKMAAIGVEPAPLNAADFGQYSKAEIPAWAKMIEIANIPKQEGFTCPKSSTFARVRPLSRS
jgi:tripartite-type tricarboxylate transporter receptor subunit TctC